MKKQFEKMLWQIVPNFDDYEPWKRDKQISDCIGQLSVYDFPEVLPAPESR